MGMGKSSKPAKPWMVHLSNDKNLNLPSFTCMDVGQSYQNKVSTFD